jgi:hypothetical protein
VSLIRRFTNQRVRYRPAAGEDPRTGRTILGDEREIPARYEEHHRLVRTNDGSEVTATTEVLMLEEPALGSRIEGREVIARESIVDKGGRVLGWTAYLI